jgi:hypothetical protein
MLKYLSKFTLDVLPSLLATVIGAYIVNHYIVAKPNAPVAAVISTTEPRADAKTATEKAAPEAAKAEARTDAKTPETSSDVTNIPEPGVRAKGISEKAVLEKAPAEKSADKPTETASIPSDTRRRPAAPREKAVAKTVPAPQPSAPPAVVPVVAAPTVVTAPNTVPPAEAATPAEEHRDANDLARAAIERLRGLTDGSPHAQEAARAPDTPRVPEAARVPEAPRVVSAPPVDTSRVVAAPPVRPLPPPIMVSTPPSEAFDSPAGSSQAKPPYADAARNDDPRRPTPPADIPASQPLDLRAEAMEPPAREHRNVAEDVLSAAKSVFHAVLPK